MVLLEKSSILYGAHMSGRHVLHRTHTHTLPPLPLTQVYQEVVRLDEQELNNKYKIGVLYCKKGQTTEEEMYNNGETTQHNNTSAEGLPGKYIVGASLSETHTSGTVHVCVRLSVCMGRPLTV